MTYNPAVPLIGQTLYVDSTNGNDATAERGTMGLKYKTIQAAINAAQDGDTVLIATGTYVENLTAPTGFSRLALQALGFENTVLTGSITWNPDSGVPQILYVVDLFISGNLNYDSTGKTGGTASFMRVKQCRVFGDWNATGLGAGNDFFQIANCSFAVGTFTQNDCIAQITSIAPDNSFITNWNQGGATTSDARPLGFQVTNWTIGAGCQIVAYSTEITNIDFGGIISRFLGCDIYGTVTSESGSYIDVRESQISGATLVGPGQIDRKVVSIPVTTPGDGSTGNVVTIDPPLGNNDYGIIQVPSTSATITQTLVHDLLFNQFQYDDPGTSQDMLFIILRGVS